MSTVVSRRAPVAPIGRRSVSAYTLPTDQPESDGTLEWSSTTIVIVELDSSDVRGLGYTYAEVATARLIERLFFDGARKPVNGELTPDPTPPGLGLQFKRADAARFAV